MGYEGRTPASRRGGCHPPRRTYSVAETNPDLQDLPRFMTAEEVAALLRVPKRTIYTWRDQGRLRARPLGPRLIRFTPEDVRTFLEASERLSP